jgi:hypothetical protein
MPVELGFILRRLAEMAEQDQALREHRPWQAAYERDYAWLGGVIEKHYAGDDSDVKVLMAGILPGLRGQTVEEYAAAAATFLDQAPHPTLGRRLRDCSYLPMVELPRYVEGHDFTCFIASGGSRDFMRTLTDDLYGVPPERGSAARTAYASPTTSRAAYSPTWPSRTSSTTGPVKPVRIWSHIGRRPILAAGNSNGNIPMLAWTGGSERPALRLLVNHDDAEREFAYGSGAEQALTRASEDRWTVVSVRDDWATRRLGDRLRGRSRAARGSGVD